MDSFEFQIGEVLENVKVEYMTFGTPEYDGEGRITNAIIYCSGSLGTFSGINKILPLTFEGCPFDKRKYFFYPACSYKPLLKYLSLQPLQ